MYPKRFFSSNKCTLPVLVFVSFLVSCEDDRSGKPKAPDAFVSFSKQLKTVLVPVDTTNKKYARSLAADVWKTYAAGDYMPIWCREDYSPNDAAEKLVSELEDMQMDGINPERYNLSEIKKTKKY